MIVVYIYYDLGNGLMSIDDQIINSFIEKHDKYHNNEKSQTEFIKEIQRELIPYEKCEELLDLISINYKDKAQTCFRIFNDTISNIVKNEQEEKFRKLKTNNKNVEQYIININESYEFMKQIGFNEVI